MGSMTRMSRAERFTKEFGDDVLKVCGIQKGKLYEVQEVYLDYVDSDEDACVVAVLQEHGPAGGDQHLITVERHIFAPEIQYGEDEIVQLCERLYPQEEITKKMIADVRKRLKKADLVD